MKWTEKEIKQTISLLKEGKNFDEISEITGRPRNAIRVKMGKLGEGVNKYKTVEIKKCLNCNNNVSAHGLKFCSSSCSATYNNLNRFKKPLNNCLICNSDTKNQKYCSRKCFNEHRKRIKYLEIENGTCQTEETRIYKKYLIDKHGEKCMDCGWCEINPHSNKIPLELHHVDANPDNNLVPNLELLCPNCHSLKNNWKGIKNSGGRHSRRRKRRREQYSNGLAH